MKKILFYLPSIIFNVIETIIIVFVGLALGISLKEISIIFIFFILVRTFFRNSLHYKDWYRCMLWSLLLFTSFFCLAKISILLSLLSVIFSGFILTQKGNIEIEAIQER